ncbi:MAG: hypothetical protein FJW38_31020 [Acidobacteria bacterium]|nr:hypothetical protein [Acidobacteriota bacterium]
MTDHRLQLGYGSAWHLLRCLGWHRQRFTATVAQAIGVESIHWMDFPLDGSNTYPNGMPIRECEWTRVNFASEDLQKKYDSFWPKLGKQQNWDAVGEAVNGGTREIILVEAKGHPAEVDFNGTDASENGGRPLIRQSFQETLKMCGLDEMEAKQSAENWLTRCYQMANRLATLHFFLKNNVPARLIFLYFCGDQHPSGTYCPSSFSEWDTTLKSAHDSLGLKGTSDLESRVHTILLDINQFTVGDAQCP